MDKAAAATAGALEPARPLVPGESYTADVVFDVPAGAGDLRLEIASLVPPTWVVIGHENSFLHKKTTFRLGA